MSSNRRVNIPRYEPLMDCMDQEELRFLKDNELLHIEYTAQEDSYLAFRDEKLRYLVKYLAKKDDVLFQLGLANFQTKPRPGKKNHGGNSRRKAAPVSAPAENTSAPSNLHQLLQEYCQYGMDGYQNLFTTLVRDERKAKKLLKKAKAAWSRKVRRMRTRQLIIDIPPDLLGATDIHYQSWRRTKDNTTKTRNDMLEEWLRELVTPSSSPSSQASVDPVPFSGNRETITHQSAQVRTEATIPDTCAAAAGATSKLASVVRSKPSRILRELLLDQMQQSTSDGDSSSQNRLEIKTVLVDIKQKTPLEDKSENSEDK